MSSFCRASLSVLRCSLFQTRSANRLIPCKTTVIRCMSAGTTKTANIFCYTVCLKTSLVLSRVLVPLSLHSHTRLRIAALKNLRQFARLEDDLLEIKYTNQCINIVRQTFARLPLFNKNVWLFVKMTLKIANNTADNTPYTARNCVASIQLGRHSAVS